MFQAGKSGNPHGRPKAEGKVRKFAQARGMDAIRTLVGLMKSENERVAVIAAQAVLDRGFGKAPQSFELPAGSSFPALIRIEFVEQPKLVNGQNGHALEFVG
jgi:hypothetical protein